MIKIPISSKLPKLEWPRPGVPEYTFNVRSYGGTPLGIGLSEYDWYLQIDSRRGALSVEYFRSDGDVPGQPIGVFRQILPDKAVIEFYDLLLETQMEKIRPAMRQHPEPTERIYTLVHEGHSPVRLVVNSGDHETNAAMQKLRYRINSLLAGSFAHGERSVRASLRLSADQKNVFEVSITNTGIERVTFADPRWLAGGGQHHRAVVLIAEFPEQKPGDPPPFLQWKEVRLVDLQPYPQNEPMVTLEPGAMWRTATQPFVRKPGMRYLAYFTWANYKGAPAVGGAYRIRGKADSERLVVNP